MSRKPSESLEPKAGISAATNGRLEHGRKPGGRGKRRGRRIVRCVACMASIDLSCDELVIRSWRHLDVIQVFCGKACAGTGLSKARSDER